MRTAPAHNGQIADENKTSLAMVPVVMPSIARSGAPMYATLPAPSIGTVLLVEDNDGLRETTEILLKMTGYRVIACCDAQVASQAFLSVGSAQPIDLLLTDIEMPGRSGIELAQELTLLRPSLPVLIVSGSLISNDLTREMELRNWKFMGKPYHLPALLGTLKTLLRSAPEAAA